MCPSYGRHRIYWETFGRETSKVSIYNYVECSYPFLSTTADTFRIGVSQIYLVARPKKTKTAMDRIRELASGPVFDRVRTLDPDFLKRIKAVNGDLVEPNMGLSEDIQREFIENVEVILHAAADVRFDETLKNAIKVNIRATRDLLDLAKRMVKLEVCTAF